MARIKATVDPQAGNIATSPVNSSAIAEVGYDGKRQRLRVVYKARGVFDYKKVSRAKFEGLMAAPSVGAYFHANILNSHPVVKVEV